MDLHTWFCSGRDCILCPDRDTALRLARGRGLAFFASPRRWVRVHYDGVAEPLYRTHVRAARSRFTGSDPAHFLLTAWADTRFQKSMLVRTLADAQLADGDAWKLAEIPAELAKWARPY